MYIQIKARYNVCLNSNFVKEEKSYLKLITLAIILELIKRSFEIFPLVHILPS